MRFNLLHINVKKCCYIHFTPGNTKNDESISNELILTLNNTVIKRVEETKFLGVIIDKNLNWKPHTAYLASKLKCEVSKLCRMRRFIPKELYIRISTTPSSNLILDSESQCGEVYRTIDLNLYLKRKRSAFEFYLVIKKHTVTSSKHVPDPDQLDFKNWAQTFINVNLANHFSVETQYCPYIIYISTIVF